jgi:hypothetical protein
MEGDDAGMALVLVTDKLAKRDAGA